MLGVIAVPGLEAQSVRCGVERWPVKVLADRDTGSIQWQPQDATVMELGAIAIPEVPYPNEQRIGPHELRVYLVRATVEHISTQDDQDWHIVLHESSRPRADVPCAPWLGAGSSSRVNSKSWTPPSRRWST